MMLRRLADLRLVAKHLLRERGLADPRELDGPLNVGILLDAGIAPCERVVGQRGRHAERLAGEQSVEALRAFGGAGRGPQQRLDRRGPAALLLGPRRPIEPAGAKLALLGQSRDLLEIAGRGFAIAEPPRSEARDPCGLRGPFAGRALP